MLVFSTINLEMHKKEVLSFPRETFWVSIGPQRNDWNEADYFTCCFILYSEGKRS
ncbi:hypothetical protein [Bacillus sp. 2205SS5-2]|uniref:hypothetical protein n=1 Tax=Bacillus sp. 2205SS5-2 TaxID=3109031 RepID=UPI003003DDC2